MEVAQCYNLHIWSLSNLLPSILVTARHQEEEPKTGNGHTPCRVGTTAWIPPAPLAGILEGSGSRSCPSWSSYSWFLSSMATHTTSPSSHHEALPAASMCQQQPDKEGDGEASCPSWGHPCSPSTAMVSSLRPTWTAQGQRQPKIFMVKAMLEMASAVLVCSI